MSLKSAPWTSAAKVGCSSLTVMVLKGPSCTRPGILAPSFENRSPGFFCGLGDKVTGRGEQSYFQSDYSLRSIRDSSVLCSNQI